MAVRIGTCSWKYPSWEGLVYSRAAGIDYLAEYAKRYDSVEIDQWFWAPPDPVTAAQYASVVPDDFRFTVKLPNAISLTHFYPKRGPRSTPAALNPNPDFLSVPLYEQTLELLAPLHGKIGLLMLQFEYLNKQKMPSQSAFLDALAAFADRIPRTLPLAIECRNPTWVNAKHFALLRERNLSHVFLEGYYMPPQHETWKQFADSVTGTTVLRLHGPERDNMEKITGEIWNRIVAPRDELLDRIAEMVADMRIRGVSVYVNINNHFEGSAPLTIQRLADRGITAG